MRRQLNSWTRQQKNQSEFLESIKLTTTHNKEADTYKETPSVCDIRGGGGKYSNRVLKEIKSM